MIYVISDIHGNMERFNSVMKQIKLKDDDTLYILGDVVDRFPAGIKLLNKIMKMPNVKMLLGNHEYMMLQALYEEYDENDSKAQAKRKHNLHQWYYNGGNVTHNSIKHISKENRKRIFEYLNSLPLNIDIEVNGVKYRLVHGSPIENYKLTKSGYHYKNEKEFSVWERWKEGCPVPEDCILVFGHTPTSYYDDTTPCKIWKCENAIGIDCGSGYYKGRLSCLRLDDMKEFYSETEAYVNLKWFVYISAFNRNSFELCNIFEHGRFFEGMLKQLKKCKTKEEFAEKIRSELMYYFWSKCEYEVLLEYRDGRIIMKPWVGNKDYELDVTDNQDFDWRGFYNEKRNERCGECIKIDVYDQVMYRFDEFVDYIWNSCKMRKRKNHSNITKAEKRGCKKTGSEGRERTPLVKVKSLPTVFFK